MKPSAIFLVAIAVLWPGILPSSAVEPGTPSVPSAWTVEIVPNPTASASKPSAARVPVRVESAKSEKLKRDIIIFSDNSREEFWFGRGLAFSLNPDKKSASVLEYRNDRVGETESGASPGFPGLWWVKGAKPAETVDRDNRKLLHYIRETIPVGTPLLLAVTEVWIDQATGLPVEAITPVATHRYTHLPTPTSDLVMPEVFRQAAEMAFQRASRREALDKAFSEQSK